MGKNYSRKLTSACSLLFDSNDLRFISKDERIFKLFYPTFIKETPFLDVIYDFIPGKFLNLHTDWQNCIILPTDLTRRREKGGFLRARSMLGAQNKWR